MKFSEFLTSHHIPYTNLELYREAFTHPSYTNEANKKVPDYQRLEFIGDAVLQLFVSEHLYKRFSDVPEGVLTSTRAKLVREVALARFARELKLGRFIRLGAGEEKNHGRDKDSILADIFEAFMGAIYLDCGQETVIMMLEKTIFCHIDDPDYDEIQDYKTKLQELMQADTRRTVTYELLSCTGPSNAPVFEVAVVMDDMKLGYGKGSSKKKAEQQAAKDALKKMAKF